MHADKQQSNAMQRVLAQRARAAATANSGDGVRYVRVADARDPFVGMFSGISCAVAKAYVKLQATARVKEYRASVYDTDSASHSCPYRLVVRFRGQKRLIEDIGQEGSASVAGMYITQYEPHAPNCGIGVTKRPKVSTVAHTAKDIGHMLIHHVKANHHLTAKGARAALDGFFVEEPLSDKIYK